MATPRKKRINTDLLLMEQQPFLKERIGLKIVDGDQKRVEFGCEIKYTLLTEKVSH